MKKNTDIHHIFKSSGGVLTARELTAEGVSRYAIKRLLNSGDIEKIKRGIYKLHTSDASEFAEVIKIVPKGIICLYSSALIHELSTFIPSEYYLAIPKKSKVRLPEYPPIHLHYWEGNQYDIGVKEMTKDGTSIALYDAEKTVCDFIKFRHKTGLDITKEVLRNYLNSSERNIDKLIKYARELRLYTIVDQYLKILL